MNLGSEKKAGSRIENVKLDLDDLDRGEMRLRIDYLILIVERFCLNRIKKDRSENSRNHLAFS